MNGCLLLKHPMSVMEMLKGISGAVGSRLAIINDRTFGTDEDGEVNTPAGRVRIHCEEIKGNSVVIQVGDPPQRLELRMLSDE